MSKQIPIHRYNCHNIVICCMEERACMLIYMAHALTTFAYAIIKLVYKGVCRISQGGGGPTLKFVGFWIYMPRAAKLRAFARGVWEYAPQENF